MADPLDRSWYDILVDDDGSGNKGTIWNRFQVDGFMDAIDASLLGLIDTTDPRLTNARPPIAHGNTHGAGGSDPVQITQAQVTGLSASMAGKVDTTDPRLSDARVPLAHNPSHAYTSTDPIDVALLAGYPSDVTLFLRGNRTWGAGPVGPQGPPGPQGPAGATGRLWEFNYVTQTIEPPISSQIRFNGSHPYTTVTRVWISVMTNDGVDITAGLMNTPVGTLLYIQDKNNAAIHVRFTTTADPVLKSGYVEYVVVWKENGNAIQNNAAVVFTAASSATINLVVREVPAGDINGSNTVFTLANALVAGSEHVFLNGLLQEAGGEDYTISGTTITYTVPPVTGDRLRVSYQRS